MSPKSRQHLSRRERQIMDAVFSLGQATAADIRERLPDPPSYSAVRAALRTLVEKGHLKFRQDGPRYVYRPTVSADSARRNAVQHLLTTFFAGSTERAVAALLNAREDISDEEFERMSALIEQAREEGR